MANECESSFWRLLVCCSTFSSHLRQIKELPSSKACLYSSTSECKIIFILVIIFVATENMSFVHTRSSKLRMSQIRHLPFVR